MTAQYKTAVEFGARVMHYVCKLLRACPDMQSCIRSCRLVRIREIVHATRTCKARLHPIQLLKIDVIQRIDIQETLEQH